MHKYFILLPLFLVLSCAEEFHTPPPLDSELGPELKSYIEANKLSPADYVVSRFADHDVVMLGEYHRVKENVELIQELIPRVYGRGVRILATEFARREDQPLIDSLLSANEYNESLSRQITFNQLAFWGFQEYVDIYKAAWQFNQQLPDTMPRFRILGINDSPDWSYVQSDKDRDNHEIMTKVWNGGGEDKWAQVILDAVAHGEKVLTYGGIHHAFSSYKQPVVIGGIFMRFDSTRCGNYLKKELGDRMMTVYLHAIWPPFLSYGGIFVYAADGQIDALFKELGPNNYPVGFDLRGTPFAKLTGDKSVYCRGYDNFTIADFADGWIFQCPISQYHGVTPIENFINGTNYEKAKRQSPNPDLRKLTIDEMNKIIRSDAKQAWWLGRYE